MVLAMVSLGNDSNTGSGGFFFNHSDSMQESDELLGSPSVSVHDEPPSHKICTPWAIAPLVLLLIGLEVAVFVIPLELGCEHPLSQHDTSPVSLCVFLHVCVWAIVWLSDCFLQWHHHKLRLLGYLEFYRRTRKLRKLPFLIFSTGNTVLLLLMALFSNYCHEPVTTRNQSISISQVQSSYHHGHDGLLANSNTTTAATTTTTTTASASTTTEPPEYCPGLHISWCRYFQIIVSLEVVLILSILIVYLVRVIKFNLDRPIPDVCQEDALTRVAHPPTNTDVGFRGETPVEELLERQADMIYYLRLHNAGLGKRIIQIHGQLLDKHS